VLALALTPLAVASAANAAVSAGPAQVWTVSPCPAEGQVSSCDADGDTIPDTAERVVCSTATCATGREDTDRDGVPDWTEVMACGTVTCASPTKDTDVDGIPDYAEDLTCGTATCANGYEDADRNDVADWASFVICGTRSCATGSEDYDGDGISDAVELMACVKHLDDLAHTGSTVAIWLIIALGAGLIGTGVVLARKRRLFQAALGQPNLLAVGDTGLSL
jgi:LPXTG-motif cell wall-anchored protein